jgi:hypothetical protein
MKNGEGSLSLNNGNSYWGNFKNNRFDGKGYFEESGGNYYMGFFKDDLFDGEGKYVTLDGKTYEGIFKEGQFPEKYAKANGGTRRIERFLLVFLLLTNCFLLWRHLKYIKRDKQIKL